MYHGKENEFRKKKKNIKIVQINLVVISLFFKKSIVSKQLKS